MLATDAIGLSVFRLFWPILLISIVFLVLVILLMKYLLNKCNESYEEYEIPPVDSFKQYLSIPQLVIKLGIWPRSTIKEGKITSYSQESYQLFLYVGGTLVTIVIALFNKAYSSVLDFGIALIFTPIFIALGKWLYIGGATIMFRYVGGIRLSYEEGKEVFSTVFLFHYAINLLFGIIGAVLCFISGVDRTLFYLGSYSKIDNFKDVVIFIWTLIIYYLLMKYRYNLSGKSSVGKIILIGLVCIGLLIVCVVIFSLIAACIMGPNIWI